MHKGMYYPSKKKYLLFFMLTDKIKEVYGELALSECIEMVYIYRKGL